MRARWRCAQSLPAASDLAVVAQYVLHIDNLDLKDVRMRLGAYNIINSYLQSLRQSAAKSFFSAEFTFELVRIIHDFLPAQN